jgi:hypothetical protein
MTFGGSHGETAPIGASSRSVIRILLALGVYLFLLYSGAHAQPQSTPTSSDLSRRNMGQVAASAEQI